MANAVCTATVTIGCTRLAAFTPRGRPKLTADGHHLREQRFDTGNRLLEESYFATDGWPCVPPKLGFHKLRNSYRRRWPSGSLVLLRR